VERADVVIVNSTLTVGNSCTLARFTRCF